MLLFLVALAGCGSRRVPTDRLSEEDAKQVAKSVDVPLYYLGESFAGLPLTGADGDGRRATLFYGTCKLSGGNEPSCSVPLQIQHFPIRPGDWQRAVGCTRRPSIRGVPTARHDGLVLFTREGIVKIYARSPREDQLVAQQLRRVRDDVRAARLPAPSAATVALIDEACRPER